MAKRDPWVSRSNLSKHAGALRVSLFVSLGLSHLACGGTVISQSDTDGGASGAGAGGATATNGGEGPLIIGGAPNGGDTTGGNLAGGSSLSFVCANPVTDTTTGLVTCENGVRHRPSARSCAVVDAAGAGGAADDIGAGGEADAPTVVHKGVGQLCSSDAECGSLPLGYCRNEVGPGSRKTCQQGCQVDSDCAQGFCSCVGASSHGGECVPGGCRVDADCGPNSLCASASQICGDPVFLCLSNEDECFTNADCASKGSSWCFVRGSAQKRTCDYAICGRPFLVDAVPRLAPIEARADWRDATTSDLTGLTALQRATLAAHWSRLGQMEHASIAAFARFNLQLLSLGAPGDLIEACNQALVDETAHTRLCFALATQYGGTRVGPGKLEVRDCFEDMSLTVILKLVIREGCIGETVAALEAVEAAARATDPAVKAALLRIARDEQSHAELAFKFLNWGLAQSSPRARRELALMAEQQLEEFEYDAFDAFNAASTSSDSEFAAHGVLDAAALRAVHLSAAGEVVRPLLLATFRRRHMATRATS